jgi:FkbM family methyltransferase
MESEMLQRLDQARALDCGPALQRLMRRPVRAMAKKLLQPLYRTDRISFRLPVPLFWGEKMTVLMPEGLIYLRHGYYEEGLTKVLLRMITKSMTFIDIGAHFGYFTLLASHLVGDSGQVHAFEPIPRTFRILSRNAARKKNVTANQCAVFSQTTSLEMVDLGPRFAGYNSFIAPRLDPQSAASTKTKKVRVSAITLDQYTRDWEVRPLFIKIDAESAESEILKGMQQTLKRLRPILAFEVGDFELEGAPQSADLIRQVVKQGYTAYSLDDGALAPHQLQPTYRPGTIIALPPDCSRDH